MKQLEPIVIALIGLFIFLTLALFCSEIFFKNDSQFFQAVIGMANNVLGAVLGIVTGKQLAKPKGPNDDNQSPS